MEGELSLGGLRRALVRVILFTLVIVPLLLGSGLVLPSLFPSSAGFAFHSALVDQGSSPALAPGATATYSLRFRNTGLATWVRGSATQVNLGVPGDSAQFAQAGMAVGWLSSTRLATTDDPVVPPGMVGKFTFNVRAPDKPGTYPVPVRLVAEGITWLDDEGVTLTVKSDLGFHSQVISQSGHPTLNPGELGPLMTVTLRNTGARPWVRGAANQQVNLGVADDNRAHGLVGVGWPTPDRVAAQSEPVVASGGIGTFTFKIRAPSAPGIYPLHLRPVADGVTWLEDDGLISLVTVLGTSGSGKIEIPAKSDLNSPGFTSTVSVEPSAAALGGAVRLQAAFTSSTATSALVAIEVYSPDGTTLVFQKWFDNEAFAAGETRSYPLTWQIPATAAPGRYTVALRAFSPGWKALFSAKQTAATFSVQAAATAPDAPPASVPVGNRPSSQPSSPPGQGPATTPPTVTPTPAPAASTAPPTPSFTTSASASPTTVAASGSVSVTSTVTATTAAATLVDVEIYAPNGAAPVYQVWFDNETFASGQQRSYPTTWQVPANAVAGTYSVKIGVYSPGWVTRYSWQSSAATFDVVAATPTPTPTPTPSQTSPGPTITWVSFNDTSFGYSGTWLTSTGAPRYSADDHFSDVADSTYTITFNGTALRLYATVASHHGIAAVSLDGGAESDVDFYAAVRQDQALVYSTSTLTPATHTLRVRVTGRKNVSSTGFVVTADRADVVGTVVPPAPTPPPTPSPVVTPPPLPVGAPAPVHVQGNRLVNAAGQDVRLHGVNRSGSEYACINNWGFFEGPTDAASLQAIKAWHVNIVRVPMNEDCWLGINGSPAAYSGLAYQQALKAWVGRINSAGMYAVLELHWSAPGGEVATGQKAMPDMDHSVTFWSQVASTFKGNDAVLLEPYNEPWPGGNVDSVGAWQCWRDGGTCPGISFQVAGMKTIVDSIRATGATNVIVLGGVGYATAMSRFLTYKPADPLNNIAAAFHAYPAGWCASAACYQTQLNPIAAVVPVIITESGTGTCDDSFVNAIIDWSEAHGSNYLAWVWNLWGTDCRSLSLVSDYSGTPTQYGQVFKRRFAAVPVATDGAQVLPEIAYAPSDGPWTFMWAGSALIATGRRTRRRSSDDLLSG